MPTFSPPRREPRVLVVAPAQRGIAWAVADPWEVRGAGTDRCRAKTRRLAMVRLVRREKPTAVLAGSGATARLAASVARELGLATVRRQPPRLPSVAARDLYPELPLRAPTPALELLATLAISAVLHSELEPRLYGKSLAKPSA